MNNHSVEKQEECKIWGLKWWIKRTALCVSYVVCKEETCHLTNFIMTSATEAQGIYTCALKHTHDYLESLRQQYKENLLYYNNKKAMAINTFIKLLWGQKRVGYHFLKSLKYHDQYNSFLINLKIVDIEHLFYLNKPFNSSKYAKLHWTSMQHWQLFTMEIFLFLELWYSVIQWYSHDHYMCILIIIAFVLSAFVSWAEDN